LPVLFAMLSNHYSFTYTGPYNWLVLVAMMAAGALIRQFFVMRHGYKLGRNGNPAPYAWLGVAVIVALIVMMRPPEPAANNSAATPPVATPVAVADVKQVMTARCVMCHGEGMQMKGVRLDSEEWINRHAQAIYQQVVVTKAMPMNNATGITDEERALIARWFELR